MLALPESPLTQVRALDHGDGADYLSIGEAAAHLRVSRVSVWRWIRDGRLAAARLGHRTIRIRREDLDGFLVRGMPSGGQPWMVKGRGNTPVAESHAGIGPAPGLDWRDMGALSHFVQFYETDDFLLDAVADFIGTALRAGDAGIIIATEAHRAGLEGRLRGAGVDLYAARADGRYVALDAAGTLVRFMVGGAPDPHRFREVIGGLVERTGRGGRRVRAFGEMVALLVGEGNPDAAVRLEALWNDLGEALPFTLFCAYPMDHFAGEAFSGLVGDICAGHSRVIPAESYTLLDDPEERLGAIAALQQKARSLEAEMVERRWAEEESARLAAIVDSSDDAIIGKTLDGIITSWNAGAERLYGYRAAEVIGRPISLLIPEDQPNELPSILARLRRGERIEHYEARRVRKNGEIVEISLTVSPVRDSTGKIVGASAIARDISERRSLEQERDAFLAAASHDLKNPLTSVKAVAQMLRRRVGRDELPDPERLDAGLATIDEAITRATRLLDELLDRTRMRMGHPLELHRGPTDLVALLARAVAECQQATERHEVALGGESGALVGEWDAVRLGRVFENLLANAVKYSPEGGPIAVTVAREEDAGGGWAVVRVRDRGIGIPAEELPRVMERFRRGSNVGKIAGSGVGLAGARQIVEQHGGSIGIESAPGEGTTVTVRLPLAPPTDENAELRA
jgi:PAS domain S-box-containing protein/excisionase family DNA binding protein